MTRLTRMTLLILVAGTFALVLFVFLLNLDLADDPAPPRDVAGMARWMARHPADWLTASALSSAALDSTLPRRHGVWRGSYELAQRLAPRRVNATAAFVQGGLFHWYELNGDDRTAVLRAAGPLLRDQAVFSELHEPLWQLTRDFDYLRANAPDTLTALHQLRDLAIANGRFADYRQLRAAAEREPLRMLDEQSATLDATELPRFIPRPIDAGDEPLVRQLLVELQRRSYNPEHLRGEIESLIDYALRHRLQPLDALRPFVDMPRAISDPTRARLALALGQADAATRIELATAVTGAGEWVPYHLDRALFEARRGRASAAEQQLRRASVSTPDLRFLAAAEETATLLGNPAAAADYRRQLAAFAQQPLKWSDACGPNELCAGGRTRMYVTSGEIVLNVEVVQSDQTPPYLEIYVDDALLAEGEVTDRRRFAMPIRNGQHHVEVRIVNPRTRGGVQRRVRLS